MPRLTFTHSYIVWQIRRCFMTREVKKTSITERSWTDQVSNPDSYNMALFCSRERYYKTTKRLCINVILIIIISNWRTYPSWRHVMHGIFQRRCVQHRITYWLPTTLSKWALQPKPKRLTKSATAVLAEKFQYNRESGFLTRKVVVRLRCCI